MDNQTKTQENKLRRMAKRQGYTIKKSRERYIYPYSATNFGEYMLTRGDDIILGNRYDATLKDIERRLLENIEFEVALFNANKKLKFMKDGFRVKDEIVDLINNNPYILDMYNELDKFKFDEIELKKAVSRLKNEIEKLNLRYAKED
jgi:hypothetical protein